VRKLLFVSGLALLICVNAFASGGQTSTAGASTSSFSRVVVTVPSVIGIDVETDVTINLSSYLANTTATTNPCPANTFPPPAFCTGAAVYDVTASTTTPGVPAPPAANTGNVWVALFCNRATPNAAPTVSAHVESDWNPSAGPGFATTALRVQRSSANNALSVGFASATNLTTSATSMPVGTLGSTFNWTRTDQFIDLAVPSASSVTFADGTFDADVIFTIAK
jgi:hypothetical protein